MFELKCGAAMAAPAAPMPLPLMYKHNTHPSPSPLTLLTHLSLLTLYPSSLTSHSSLLTPHPSPLTPHSSPSPLPHLTSLPTFSIVRKCLERGRKEEWGTYLPPPPSWSLGVVHQTGSHEVGLSDLAACVQVEEAEVARREE